MNGHLEQWLDAYRDGELNDLQTRQAEAHLESCPACRAELDQRRALSALLRAEPSAAGLKSESRFVAEVGLRLQREPAVRRGSIRLSAVAWGMIPVALTLAWVFIQAAFFVSGVVESIPGAGEAVTQGLSAGIPQARRIGGCPGNPAMAGHSGMGWLECCLSVGQLS